VDRRRVAEHEFIKLAERVGHFPVIEGHREFFLLAIDAGHEADVAVEDLAVVVVLGLHHLVANAEAGAELVDAVFIRWVERHLQGLVDAAGAGRAAVHRAQHLNVAHRIEVELAR
jgi:hypothetical protein